MLRRWYAAGWRRQLVLQGSELQGSELQVRRVLCTEAAAAAVAAAIRRCLLWIELRCQYAASWRHQLGLRGSELQERKVLGT